MLQRILCPSLVGRDKELFVLEAALLAARGGDGRFVALGADAGIEAAAETLELKGFDGAQRAWRLAAGVQR